jgi:hypothetical protein
LAEILPVLPPQALPDRDWQAAVVAAKNFFTMEKELAQLLFLSYFGT